MAETEIKSINGKTLADATAREKKLDKNQGTENAGKILGIGVDGNVVPQKPVQALAGSAAPTTATSGVVGQEYYVIVNNAVTEMYVCTSALIGSYTWDKVEFDGACMDITGAKVGQIAKITAVDDSGKPTAWEAVDMPSGGGSGGKQLLYRHNISQDTVLTTDSFDTSGANIDLSVYSRLYILGMFICNSPTETFGLFYLNGTKFAQLQYFNRKSGQNIGFVADIVCLKTQNESSAGLLSFAWCSEFRLDKFDAIYSENGANRSRINGNIQSIGFSANSDSDIFAVKAGSYVEVWGD